MNASTADIGITHFNRLLAVAKAVRDSRLAIVRHEYFPMLSGNFTVEFIDSWKVTQFEWDGIDGYLDIRTKQISNSHVTSWRQISHASLDFLPEEPYQTIQTYLLENNAFE